MKIAVCIYGHLRTYENCIDNLKKKLLSKYDTDIFMHTWSTSERETSYEYRKEIPLVNNTDTSGCSEKLYALYNLKSLVIEKQEAREKEFGYYILHDKTIDGKKASLWGVHCMFHSMMEANKLREEYEKQNNIKYDFVLFIRPDVLLIKEFNLENYIYPLKEDELKKSFFCCAGAMWNTRINDIRMFGGGDYLFFASPEAISNIFDNIPKMLEQLYDGIQLKDRVIENYFHFMIKDLGYNFWIIDYIIHRDFTILRADSEVVFDYFKLCDLLLNYCFCKKLRAHYILKILRRLIKVLFWKIKNKNKQPTW